MYGCTIRTIEGSVVAVVDEEGAKSSPAEQVGCTPASFPPFPFCQGAPSPAASEVDPCHPRRYTVRKHCLFREMFDSQHPCSVYLTVDEPFVHIMASSTHLFTCTSFSASHEITIVHS
jgi:hypothetical protein